MPDPPPWQPILTGADAARATAAVLDVARALRDPASLSGAAPTPDTPGVDLASGNAGVALLYAYLGAAEQLGAPGLSAASAGLAGIDSWDALADEHLGYAIEAMATQAMPPSLFGGFAGIAWAVEHIDTMRAADGGDESEPGFANSDDDGHGNRGPDEGTADGDDPEDEEDGDDPEDEEDGDDIDHALLGFLQTSPWPRPYDLMSGLVGYGVYALERLPRASARACLTSVLARLEELAVWAPDGCYWPTPPPLLPARDRAGYPNGYVNLGLSHGAAGVIALLARATTAGFSPARALLDGAVRWLLARPQPDAEGSRFSAVAEPDGVTATATRVAWCYGDPGIAAALALAAEATERDDWAQAAGATYAASMRRPTAACRVHDAGLCHGSAGLALIYQRAACRRGLSPGSSTRPRPASIDESSSPSAGAAEQRQEVATAETLAAAARRWLKVTLDSRTPDGADSVAGFRAHAGGTPDAPQWAADPGLLTGAAGVALALLAATTEVAPAWDRVILLSSDLTTSTFGA